MKVAIFSLVFLLSISATASATPEDKNLQCTNLLINAPFKIKLENSYHYLEDIHSPFVQSFIREANHLFRGGKSSYIGQNRNSKNQFYKRSKELMNFDIQYHVEYINQLQFSLVQKKDKKSNFLQVINKKTGKTKVIFDSNSPPDFLNSDQDAKKGFLSIESYGFSHKKSMMHIIVSYKDTEQYYLLIYDLSEKRLHKRKLNINHTSVEWKDESRISYFQYSREGWNQFVTRVNINGADDTTTTPKKNSILETLINLNPKAEFSFIGFKNDKEIYLVKTSSGQPVIALINPNQYHSKYWETIALLPEAENFQVSFLRAFKDKIFLSFNKNLATQKLIVVNLKTKQFNSVPNVPKNIRLGEIHQINKNNFEFKYDSFLIPFTTVRYNYAKNKTKIISQVKIPADFNKFTFHYKEVSTKDGESVPIFIIHKKDLELNQKNPTLIDGYGGFGLSTSVGFESEIISIIENGGVYVVTAPRGGLEKGAYWHEQGKLLNKINTYKDMIAVTEYMIEEGYTTPAHLAITGRSNGGLTAAAVAVMRPDLFKLALPGVGVLDMFGTEQMDVINSGWNEEFGSIKELRYALNKMIYSPLQKLNKNTKYPAFLIYTGQEDQRVNPAHSYKFYQALKDIYDFQKRQGLNPNPVYLRAAPNLGHGLFTTIDRRASEWSDILTIFFKETK